jgi:hypothetical protein
MRPALERGERDRAFEAHFPELLFIVIGADQERFNG